jgi:hypothetical protein
MTSGHCLGTFQTAKLCFDYTPLPNGSVSHNPPQLSSFLSLSLSLPLSLSLSLSLSYYNSPMQGLILISYLQNVLYFILFDRFNLRIGQNVYHPRS